MKAVFYKIAKRLRVNQTDAESKVWFRLRNAQAGSKFRRQHRIGNYIVDFVCLEKKLVIEIDGGQHTQENDKKKSDFLIAEGFRILRFWNDEVHKNLEGVSQIIIESLQAEKSPSPDAAKGCLDLSPQGRGE